MNVKTEFKTSDLDKLIMFKVPKESAIVRVVVNLKGFIDFCDFFEKKASKIGRKSALRGWKHFRRPVSRNSKETRWRALT